MPELKYKLLQKYLTWYPQSYLTMLVKIHSITAINGHLPIMSVDASSFVASYAIALTVIFTITFTVCVYVCGSMLYNYMAKRTSVHVATTFCTYENSEALAKFYTTFTQVTFHE